MYAKPLVYGLTAYECIRQHLQADNLNDRINIWIETHIPDDTETVPCDGSILCERTGVRHKTNCLGKTESFDSYCKGLLSAEA